MHLEFNIFGWWWFIIVVGVLLFWAMYRLWKRFTRRCNCGHWFRVKRIKIMEEDQDAPDNIFGKMYYVYILGLCPCGMVHHYKTFHCRFSGWELLWRHVFHRKEFNRSDAQKLLQKAGIDFAGHPVNGDSVGHKPPMPTVVLAQPSFKVPVLHGIEGSKKRHKKARDIAIDVKVGDGDKTQLNTTPFQSKIVVFPQIGNEVKKTTDEQRNEK